MTGLDCKNEESDGTTTTKYTHFTVVKSAPRETVWHLKMGARLEHQRSTEHTSIRFGHPEVHESNHFEAIPSCHCNHLGRHSIWPPVPQYLLH